MFEFIFNYTHHISLRNYIYTYFKVSRRGNNMKKCPFCGRSIQDNAVVCNYCNRGPVDNVTEFSSEKGCGEKGNSSTYRFSRDDFMNLFQKFSESYEDLPKDTKGKLASNFSPIIIATTSIFRILLVGEESIQEINLLIWKEGMLLAWLCFYVGAEYSRDNVEGKHVPYYLHLFSNFFPQYVTQFIQNIISVSHDKNLFPEEDLKAFSSDVVKIFRGSSS